jgi:ferredoxin like protein
MSISEDKKSSAEQERPSFLTIEARLGANVFKVDKERHIVPKEEECKVCTTRHCLYVCPAHLYTLDKEGMITFNHEGCLECGTCRITCLHLTWNFPKGGYGVQYRFG